MSDDELERLAAAMKNVTPSDAARKTGMSAAMAAFDAEFAVETADTKEKISTTTQGLKRAARPTGQTTYAGYVQIRGRDAMSKVKEFFTAPKAMMMMGTCAAALFATSLYVPNTRFEEMPMPAPEAVTAEVGTSEGAEADQIVVTGKRAVGQDAIVEEDFAAVTSQDVLAETLVATVEDADKQTAPTVTTPQGQGGINSISDLLNQARSDSAKTETKNRDREAKFRQRGNEQSRLTAQAPTPQATVPQFAPPPVKARPSIRIADTSPRKAEAQTQIANGLILEEVPAEYKTETKTIVTKEATTEIVKTPPTFETVTETVVTQSASTELVVIPPEYGWVEGEVEGSSVEYVKVPAQYETVQEPVVVQEASTELVTIPPVYNTDGTVAVPASTQERVVPSVTKMETRRVIKTPAATIERVVPYEIKDGKTRVPVRPAQTVERVIPPKTQQVTRRVIKTPASTQERVIPPGTRKEVNVRTLVAPQKFYLRNSDSKIVREFESRDQFEKYQASLTTSVKETPVSTFSVDVDTASYSFLRSAINRGQLPPRSAIRLEELINYFPYDYEAPRSADEPFKANVTVTPNPWNTGTKLMHIGIKGYVPEMDEKPRSNIVFLIDTSGSMNQPNKLPLLISSFKLLLSTLDADDTVSIVTYAGSAGTVLEPTAASEKGKIKEALNQLRSDGSTAGAAGLELAYQKAQESFDEDGVNRVILATDGDFNVGFSSPDEMRTYIEKKRESGIFLSVLGFGNGNYNDHLMQSLAQNGNGVAAYIDTLAEANKVLANEAGSALITIAKDVKIQVEFNPATVAEYRLIGYETRALKRQDFNNDKVDAGEINAGHTVTAIYEMTPVGSPAQVIDELRYASDAVQGNGSDEYAFVKIRHKLPSSDTSTLQTFPVGEGQERSLRRASDDMRFATAVAAFGQKLRGDTQLEDYSYDDLIKLATNAKGKDENGYRAEFIQLMRLAENLGD